MSNVTVSLSYASAYGATFESFVTSAASDGFRSVQLIPDQEPNLYSDFSSARTEKLSVQLRKLGLDVSLHNVFYDINPVSLVPDVREAAFGITRRVFDLARGLGCRCVTVHPGYMFGGWRSDPQQARRFWVEAERSLRRLGELGAEYGLEVAIENGSYYICTASGPARRPLHLGITPDEVARLVTLSGNALSVCLDLNKALRSGYPIEEFVKAIGSRVAQVQVSTVGKYRDVTEAVLRVLVGKRDLEIVLEGSRGEAEEGYALLKTILNDLGAAL